MTRGSHLPKMLFNIGVALASWLSASLPARSQPAPDALPPAPPATNDFFFRDLPNPVLFYGDDATAQRMFTTLI